MALLFARQSICFDKKTEFGLIQWLFRRVTGIASTAASIISPIFLIRLFLFAERGGIRVNSRDPIAMGSWHKPVFSKNDIPLYNLKFSLTFALLK